MSASSRWVEHAVLEAEIAGLALHLRQLHPELPVVLATGYSASAEQARREGFTILRKPYDLDSLALALRSALARRVTV